MKLIAGQLGTLIKVDEFTSTLARSKFARVCIDIDLSKPLCCGFWLGDDFHRVFVVVMYEKLPTFCYSCGLIGHGSNNCPASLSTVKGSPQPPSLVTREQAVGGGPVQVDEAGNHDSSTSIPPAPVTVEAPNSVVPDSDFGPWLLVTRRRGSARGRGGGVRVNPETRSTAAAVSPEDRAPRSLVFGGTRGGRSGLGQSHSRNPNITYCSPINSDATALETIPTSPISTVDPSSVSPPTVDLLGNTRPRDLLPTPLSLPNSNSAFLSVPPRPDKRCLVPSVQNLGKSTPSIRSNSPPPILHSSLHTPPHRPSQPERSPHLLIVDQVSAALNEEIMDEDSDGDPDDDIDSDDDGESDDDGMSQDDEPEDDMTLIQYQAEVRRDALIRKSSHSSCSSPKKGRMEMDVAGP